jgi:hypothetical protein
MLSLIIFEEPTISITQVIKFLTVVIPAKAGIQKKTGCRIKACPGLDPGSGMTGFGYLATGGSPSP